MKNLIDQLNELEEQILFIRNRLIQLSLFEESDAFSKSKTPRELRNSVNFFTNPGNHFNKKIETRFSELYDRKKKKLHKNHEFLVNSNSSFAKLSKVLAKNHLLLGL